MPKTTNRKISSTPTNRMYNVRESLGFIKKDTVSGMVNLSLIKETSPCVSIDSGYGSISFRHRSKSFGTKSIRDIVMNSYAEYPNFKWKYLKYFGEDPKEYLSRFDIYLDQSATDEDRIVPKKTIGNWVRVGNDEAKVCEREISQTFSVTRSGDQLNNQNAMKKHKGNGIESESAVTLVNEKTDFTRSESLATEPNKNEIHQTSDIADLKFRIRESIQAYEIKCEQKRHQKN